MQKLPAFLPMTNHLQKFYTVHSLDVKCFIPHRAIQTIGIPHSSLCPNISRILQSLLYIHTIAHTDINASSLRCVCSELSRLRSLETSHLFQNTPRFLTKYASHKLKCILHIRYICSLMKEFIHKVNFILALLNYNTVPLHTFR